MSEQNVEIVREFFEAIERAFDAYWGDPRSIATALRAHDLWPEWAEVFERVHPEVEWQTVFLGQTYRGHLEAARAWDDFLDWATDYRPSLDDVADLRGDYVYAVLALVGKGKDSSVRMGARFYDVITVRDGLIVRIEEYTARAEALEAATGYLSGGQDQG